MLSYFSRPFTYDDLQRLKKVHGNELREALDTFIEDGCIIRHRLRVRVLIGQKGRPEYYILNIDHPKILKILAGRPVLNEVKIGYQSYKDSISSVEIMKKT